MPQSTFQSASIAHRQLAHPTEIRNVYSNYATGKGEGLGVVGGLKQGTWVYKGSQYGNVRDLGEESNLHSRSSNTGNPSGNTHDDLSKSQIPGSHCQIQNCDSSHCSSQCDPPA